MGDCKSPPDTKPTHDPSNKPPQPPNKLHTAVSICILNPRPLCPDGGEVDILGREEYYVGGSPQATKIRPKQSLGIIGFKERIYGNVEISRNW